MTYKQQNVARNTAQRELMKNIKTLAELFLKIFFLLSIIYVLVSLFIFERIFDKVSVFKSCDQYLRCFFFEYSLFFILGLISDYFKDCENILKKIFGIFIGSVFSFLYVFINEISNITTNQYNKIVSIIIIILLFLSFIFTFIFPNIIKLHFFIKIKEIENNSYENQKRILLEKKNRRIKKINRKYEFKKKMALIKFNIQKFFIPIVVIVKVIKNFREIIHKKD